MSNRPTYEELEQRVQELEQIETKNRRLEKELFASREITQGILNAVPVRIFWKDKNLIYMGCNKLFAHDAGFDDPKDIVGKDDYQMGWRDQAELYRKDDREVIESGKPKFLIEEPQKTPAGKSITLLTSKIPLKSSTGQIRGVLGSYMDITERKQAEDIQGESGQQYRLIAENSTDMIARHTPEGVFQYVSPACRELLGYEPEELLGRSAFEFIHPEDLDRIVKSREMVVQGSDIDTPVFRLRNKDGAFVWVESVSRSIRDEKTGLVTEIQVSTRNITDRKQAEEALQKNEEKHRAYVENAPLGLFVVDGTGKFIDVNPKACELLGYTRNELLRLSLSDTSNLKETAENFRQLKKEGLIKYEGELKKKDGSIVNVRFDAVSIPNDQFMTFCTDITERKRAEEIRRISEARLKDLFNKSAIPLCLINKKNVKLEFNEKFGTTFGYTAEDIPTINEWWQLAYPDPVYRKEALDICEVALNRAIEKKSDLEPTEYHITCKNGDVRDMVLLGSSIGSDWLLTFYDITERKQVEKALRESEEKYRTFFENSCDAMLMHQDDLFVDCNAAAAAALGLEDPKDILNVHPSEISPEYQPDGKKSYDKAIKMIEIAYTRGTHRFEWVHITRNGDTFPVEISLTAIPSQGGKRLLSVWRDIAKRKQAEEERVRLEMQLHQVQKMESIGRLAGGIAHDFNNILVPIIGYVELGVMKLSPEDKLSTYLKRIREAAEQATDLTQQILAFSRKQVLEMQVLDLNVVVADFKNMVQRLIGEDIEFETFLTSDLYPIKADKGQLEQVLLNLVVNARDAMPMGGKLTIETSNVYLDEAYANKHQGTSQSPCSFALLAVSDTGHGMDSETQQQIFEPFFTTKSQDEGTGLGLATVFGIIKQHGGNIWVYSELDKGTTFKVYLPQTSEIEQSVETPQVEAESLSGTETILVVEDEKMVRKLVCETLATYGYKVIEAQTGKDGLRHVLEYKEPIDLLLTDVVMPEMNGRELYQKVVAIRPTLRVLFMSGYTDNVIAHHGILEEGINFLQKPFTTHSLTKKVRQILS